MNAKTTITLGLLAIFTVFTMMPASAWAGSPQSHRWEGVAIGVGAAIIGTALIKAAQNANEAAYASNQATVAYHHRRPAGHWETQRAWVPPVYEKTWNPGHYSRHGRWIQGHWIQVETRAGYWTQERVWVPAR